MAVQAGHTVKELDPHQAHSDARARERLSELARGWFPTLEAGTIDRVVAAAWLDGRAGEGDEPQATRAAATLRRLGLKALRGERLVFDDAVEGIASDVPVLLNPGVELGTADENPSTDTVVG